MKNGIRSVPWWFFILLQLGFVALYFLAYYFRFERTQLEAAKELMCIINNEWFCTAVHGRFTVILSQFSALILVKAGASLDSIITAYSLHHVAFFHFLSISCLVIGSWRAALIQVTIPVAAIGASYFMWPFAEMLYGIGIAFAGWAVWKHLPNTGWSRNFALTSFVFLVFASHPLAVIIMLLLVSLDSVSTNSMFFMRPLALLILYLVYRFFFSGPIPITPNGEMLWDEIFEFMRHPQMFLDVWGLILMMFLALITTERPALKLALVLSGLLMAGLAIQIVGHTVELYHAVVVMIALHVILQASYVRINPLKPALLLVAVFVLFNVKRTFRDSMVYTARKNLIEQLIEEARSANQPCSVLDNTNRFPDDDILLSSSFRQETLLLSSISGNTVCVIYDHNFSQFCEGAGERFASNNPVKQAEGVLKDCNIKKRFPYFRCDEELNRYYFPLDTSSNYELLEPDLADWESEWIDPDSGEFIPHFF